MIKENHYFGFGYIFATIGMLLGVLPVYTVMKPEPFWFPVVLILVSSATLFLALGCRYLTMKKFRIGYIYALLNVTHVLFLQQSLIVSVLTATLGIVFSIQGWVLLTKSAELREKYVAEN